METLRFAGVFPKINAIVSRTASGKERDPIMDKMQALAVIDGKKDWLDHLGDQVWDCAETAFQEFGSMKILCDALAEAGFEVAQNVGMSPLPSPDGMAPANRSSAFG